MSKLCAFADPPVNEHVADGGQPGYLRPMADHDLLLRYRTTRQAMVTVCGHDSSCSSEERRAAMRQHAETLELIEARFPDIKFAHSTGEWHLQQAIDAVAGDAQE
jgi:hypothetical protein